MIDSSARIHETAIVEDGVSIGAGVTVGPWTYIGKEVEIGEGTVIGSHCVIKGPTKIGCRNRIFQFASIGEDCQDKKYAGERTYLEIGDDNVIREHCSMHRGTVQDEGITRVGHADAVDTDLQRPAVFRDAAADLHDAAVLVDGGKPAEDHPVSDMDMPCKRRVVGKDAVIAHAAVMRHMGVDHEEVPGADPGDALVLHGAAVHRAVLADDVVIADPGACGKSFFSPSAVCSSGLPSGFIPSGSALI